MRHHIDGKRQGIQAKGPRKVSAVTEWAETPTGRRKTDVQANDERTGLPLWSIECEHDDVEYGEETTVIFQVEVGADEFPQPKRNSDIEFENLICDVRFNRKTGVQSSRWTATGITKIISEPGTDKVIAPKHDTPPAAKSAAA